MTFSWWADDGRLFKLFGSSPPLININLKEKKKKKRTKKNPSYLDPFRQNLLDLHISGVKGLDQFPQ